MALFSKKQDKQKTPAERAVDMERQFFNEYLREELQSHARRFFEDIIKENGEHFKQELQQTVAQVNEDLKKHVVSQLDSVISQINLDIKQYVTSQLNEQFVEYSEAMKQAQDAVKESLTKSAESLHEQHRQLSESLQRNAADQEKALEDVLHENTARLSAMRQAQDTALRSLNEGAEALRAQHEYLSETLEKNVDEQQDILLKAFESNMARIVEHYLLEAVGDQYDLKSQLPAIMKQLERNKQVIADDMKL